MVQHLPSDGLRAYRGMLAQREIAFSVKVIGARELAVVDLQAGEEIAHIPIREAAVEGIGNREDRLLVAHSGWPAGTGAAPDGDSDVRLVSCYDISNVRHATRVWSRDAADIQRDISRHLLVQNPQLRSTGDIDDYLLEPAGFLSNDRLFAYTCVVPEGGVAVLAIMLNAETGDTSSISCLGKGSGAGKIRAEQEAR